MKSDRQAPVAIIGGGFSGTILAAQLARREIDCVLADGSGRLGKGVAYSTREPAHLLNVRAEGMSAWADEPDDFAKKFESLGGDRKGFAQRRMFADYLAEILEQAIASGRTLEMPATAISASTMGRAWMLQPWSLPLAIRRLSRFVPSQRQVSVSSPTPGVQTLTMRFAISRRRARQRCWWERD
jgi:uncharacterized NAD(P)/FAD-binding protein YdhS